MENRKISDIIAIIIPTEMTRLSILSDLKQKCHYLVTDKSGVQIGLPIFKPAKLVKGKNKHSIVIVYITDNNPKDVIANVKDYPVINGLVKELTYNYNLDIQTLYYERYETE